MRKITMKDVLGAYSVGLTAIVAAGGTIRLMCEHTMADVIEIGCVAGMTGILAAIAMFELIAVLDRIFSEKEQKAAEERRARKEAARRKKRIDYVLGDPVEGSNGEYVEVIKL